MNHGNEVQRKIRPNTSNCVQEVNHVVYDSNAHIAVLEVMRCLSEAAAWNKKHRIVLEYDPAVKKCVIKVFSVEDGSDSMGC